MAKIKQPDERSPSTPGPKPKLDYSEALVTQIRSLGKIQATVEEIASVLQVAERTLQNFFTTYPDVKDAHETGKAEGRASLRRAQFAKALGGDATMQIWLGKQLLGQREPVRQLEVGKPGSFDQMDDDQLLEYIDLAEKEYKEISQALLPPPEAKGRKTATKH